MFTAQSIPSPKMIKDKIPLEESLKTTIDHFRSEAIKVVTNQSSKFPVIIGPCSIHDAKSALQYAHFLKEMDEKLGDRLFLVMRAYIEKPRTTIGWKGLLYDPFLNGTDDINEGLTLSRSLLKKIAEIGIPIATEFVSTIAANYFEDLITWGFIGARTSSSQIHREYASSLSFPIGFKNSVDGNLEIAMDGMISSRSSHSFLGIDETGKAAIIRSTGNPYSHLVLRGSNKGANYDRESIGKARKFQENSGVHSKVFIDCGHGNSQKNHLIAEEVFQDLIRQISQDRTSILGLMIESHLEEGAQPLELGSPLSPEISITDPCIGLTRTRDLLFYLYDALASKVEMTV